MKLLLHWIQTSNALGFLGRMVSSPSTCRLTFARGQLSYSDQPDFFSRQICLSNMSTPSVRTRAFSCGFHTQLASTGGKVTVLSMRCTLISEKLCWTKLTRSLIEAARSNLCLCRLELCLSSTRSPCMLLTTALGAIGDAGFGQLPFAPFLFTRRLCRHTILGSRPWLVSLPSNGDFCIA